MGEAGLSVPRLAGQRPVRVLGAGPSAALGAATSSGRAARGRAGRRAGRCAGRCAADAAHAQGGRDGPVVGQSAADAAVQAAPAGPGAFRARPGGWMPWGRFASLVHGVAFRRCIRRTPSKSRVGRAGRRPGIRPGGSAGLPTRRSTAPSPLLGVPVGGRPRRTMAGRVRGEAVRARTSPQGPPGHARQPGRRPRGLRADDGRRIGPFLCGNGLMPTRHDPARQVRTPRARGGDGRPVRKAHRRTRRDKARHRRTRPPSRPEEGAAGRRVTGAKGRGWCG